MPSIFRVLTPVAFLAVALSAACPSTTGSPSPEPSSPEPVDDGGQSDAGPSDAGQSDAGQSDGGQGDGGQSDGGQGDGGQSDAGPPGAACSFNRDCRVEERCECDELTGCFCAIGERGEGVLGVTACVDGNDCASSLCLEGPNDALVCSGPCETAEDCQGETPVCADIAFVGRICIRQS